MVRQAHTYLAGAVSGSALIAAAVVAFVLLVSLQALRDWPLAGIGGGSDGSGLSSGHPATGAGRASAAGAGAAAAHPAGAAAARNAAGHGTRAGQSKQQLGAATPGASTSPAPGTSPAAQGPGSNPASGGGAVNPPGQSASSSGGGGGGTGGGGGGGGPVTQPGGAGSGQSTSGAVTGAVNNTVSGVDQALGGTLGNAGVTNAGEEAVNNVAGPESPVGETVDKVVETVGGLLDGKR